MKLGLIDAVALEHAGKGVSRYLRNILPTLLRLSDNDLGYVAVVTSEAAEELPLDVSDRLTIAEVGSGVLWEQFWLPRLARRMGADVIFRHGEIAPMWGSRSLLHVPEDPAVRWQQTPLDWKESGRRLYERRLIEISLRRASGLVFSTQAMADHLLGRLGLKLPYSVRPLGVDPVFLNEGGSSLPPWIDDGPYLFHLGSSDERDLTLPLLHSYLSLPETSDDLPRLVIAGDLGGLATVAAEQIPSGSRHQILLVGRLSDNDLAESYRHAVCCLCPSTGEGFGLQPLEAMATGCGVITSETASAIEVLGSFATYMRTLDPLELDRSLNQFRGHEDATRRAARRDHAASFRWENLATGLDRDVRGSMDLVRS